MLETTGTNTIDEVISKQQFFIDLYNNKVHEDIIDAFEDDANRFARLGVEVTYRRSLNNNIWNYYLDPKERPRESVGYKYRNKR